MARTRILVVSPRYPYPPLRGDQRRVSALSEALAAHADVAVVAFGTGPPAPDGAVEVVPVQRTPMSVLRGNVACRNPWLPGQVRLFVDVAMRHAVLREIERRQPTVLHVTLSRMAHYLVCARPGIHRHLDLVDALSLNMATRADASRAPMRAAFRLEAALMRRYERDAVKAAHTSSIVSPQDRDADPAFARTAVIPNGVDRHAFPFREPASDGAPILLFFGNLGYFHNVAPARFVAADVLPRVRAAVPDVRLRLVGARPAREVQALSRLDGVELVGPVERMVDELHGATLAVLPSFSGSGIKNTVLEALSSGIPVVLNRQAVRAVEGSRAGQHFVQAETATEVAAACVDLLIDPARRRQLALEGDRLIDARYTWSRQAEALLSVYGV